MIKKNWAALALSGAMLAACASEKDEGPVYHAGGGHHRRASGGMMSAPVITPDVFLLLPYDANHDHRIDKSERKAAIDGAWREVSAGHTTLRLLDLQDWLPKVEGPSAEPFNALEFAPEGGGVITREQFGQGLTRRFEALDKNADGLLEPSELTTIPKFERDEGRMDSGGMSQRRGPGAGSPGGGY